MKKKIKEIATTIEKKAALNIRRLKKITVIKTTDDFNKAGILLKSIKAVRKEADAEMREKLVDVKAEEVRIKSAFKPFFDKVDTLETDYKLKMSIYLENVKKAQLKLNDDFSKGKINGISKYNDKLDNLTVTHVKGGASIRKVKKLTIEDENKIPREYLVPNESAIRRAFIEGKDVPGCKYEEDETISI